MAITFRILTSSSDISQTTQSLDPSTDLSPTAGLPASLPDHTQLPDSDGNFVFAERAAGKNFQESPEGDLLMDCITPILQQLHPDGQYCIGRDCGIYWRMTEPLVNGRYQLMPANERGHYPIEPLGVELGIWQGVYQNQEWPWLRWWDAQGNLLLTAEERLEQERQEKELAQQRAERLAEQLRALGVEPEL